VERGQKSLGLKHAQNIYMQAKKEKKIVLLKLSPSEFDDHLRPHLNEENYGVEEVRLLPIGRTKRKGEERRRFQFNETAKQRKNTRGFDKLKNEFG